MPAEHTYTIYARWPDGTIEEIDVAATGHAQAEALAAVELERDYLPGWEILRSVTCERVDGTFFF